MEPLTKFSKRGWGLTGSQFLEEGCWEWGGNFFQGRLQFLQITIEQRLSLKSIFLKILTKNLVSWLDGFKDEKI